MVAAYLQGGVMSIIVVENVFLPNHRPIVMRYAVQALRVKDQSVKCSLFAKRNIKH